MRNSAPGNLYGYDFVNGDEAEESAAERFTRKHMYQRNPKDEESLVTKDHFLECFSHKSDLQQTGTADAVCIGSVAIDGDAECGSFTCNNRVSFSVGPSGRSFATEEASSSLVDILLTTSKDCSESDHSNQVNFELFTGCVRVDSHAMGMLSLGMPSMDGRQLSCPPPELPSDENLVDVSDDEASLDESSVSISGSDIHEDDGALGPSALDHYSRDYSEMDDTCLVVVVSPAYVLYGDRLCTEPVLTFSSDCVKLVLDANGNGENIIFEWAIADINSIKFYWAHSVAIAWLRIDLCPTPGVEAESVRGTSGPVKLECVVDDQQWFEKQQRIMSLSERYSAVWKLALDAERSGEEGEYSGPTMVFVSTQCITWEDEPFQDVIYPKGDPDAVSISKRDVELLKPETFINDTIIDFYIKYLMDMIQPEDRNRFYFFNSFFFRKLADLDKNPGSAFESKAAFQRVRKWTRKVNIFEKDYIFIPVNFNLHWSLIVICHPGEAAYFKDSEMGRVHRVPCILHMDSIKGSHYGLKDLVQSYLWEEWRERHREENESFQDVSMKFSNLRYVPLELPQQENLYDCGLFLLHYVELFLKEAPINFSPFKITKFTNFLNKNWFVPSEASAKRFHIQKLILGLHDEHSQAIPPAACGDLQLCFDSDKVDAEFVSEECNSPKACFNSSLCSTTDLGIEIKLLPTSPMDGVLDYKEAGLVYREFFESGVTVATSTDGQLNPFHKTPSLQQLKCTMTPIAEEAEACDLGTPYSVFGETTCRPSSRIMAETCAAMDSPKEFNRFDMFCLPQFSMRKEHDDMESSMSSDPLSCGSQHSSQDRVLEHPPTHQSMEFAGHDQPGETNKPGSISSENCECVTRSRSVSSGLENWVVEDSQKDDTMAESKESGDSFFSCQDNLPASENDLPSESAHSADDDVVPRRKQWGHKRLKLMAANGVRPLTRSVSKGRNL